MSGLLTRSDAVISDCGLFRYSLSRRWSGGGMMIFIMLNPSTADASNDDPTIRRCIGFAKREGMGSLRVVNLFGLRATNPDELLKVGFDPTGPDNWRHVGEAMDEAKTIVCAWGANNFASTNSWRLKREVGMLKAFCLGKTKSGHPRHPLYVKSDQPLMAFF